MAEKRKDSKGRNLFKGESQRANGTYMYRCTDEFGKRHTIYAKTLNELRDKEKQLIKDLEDQINITSGNMTVHELVLYYISLNTNWSMNTRYQREMYARKIGQSEIGSIKIRDLRPLHIKRFYHRVNTEGMSASGIDTTYQRLLRPAFEIAVENDYVRKNPFNIKLDFLEDRHKSCIALTELQIKKFLDFVICIPKELMYYHIFTVLLETGLRISEFCGLTLNDIDFDNRILDVNHQLLYRKENNSFYISGLKTESSNRKIYLTDKAYISLLYLRLNRDNESTLTLGEYKDFLLTKRKRSGLITYVMITKHLEKAVRLYNDTYPEDKIPRITPHDLRHTFCTRMIEKGLDIKSLQYLMGHSRSSTTMDIYTHWSSEKAVDSMKSIDEHSDSNLTPIFTPIERQFTPKSAQICQFIEKKG